MPARNLLLIPALLVAASAFGQTPPHATATFVDAKGAKIGTATIEPTANGRGVLINATLTGLPPGTHAVHIHTVGKCDPPDFVSAGGHFNPEKKQHGHLNPQGSHAGDLPNFDVLNDGIGRISMAVGGVTLSDTSLFQPGGTALVIHAAADDYKTDPTGNAGARIACGVITR